MTICTYCGKLGGHWRKGDACPSPANPENRTREAKASDHAERIARRIADAEWDTAPASMTGPEKARRYHVTLSTARAAALAALTEKEDAR